MWYDYNTPLVHRTEHPYPMYNSFSISLFQRTLKIFLRRQFDSNFRIFGRLGVTKKEKNQKNSVGEVRKKKRRSFGSSLLF